MVDPNASEQTDVDGVGMVPDGPEIAASVPRAPAYRYGLCRELDSGGMATVYLARLEGPSGFEKLVALKSIHPHLAKRREIVEMFLDEAQIVAEISHPNVCSVIDFGAVGSTYFIAMEYLFGETLSRLVRRVRKLEAPPAMWHSFVASIIASAAEGLHAAHELRDSNGQPRHVIHRDVTPNNISIAYDGSVRVMDFGIARAEGQLHQTQSIALKGKIPYMAPEQFKAGAAVDRRVDVWSLGVVLWELLTLKRLFRRATDPQTALAICQDPIGDPREVDPSIPDVLAHAATLAVCRDPNERLPTARDLSQLLRGYLATLGRPLGMPEISELMDRVFVEEKRERQALVDDARNMADPAPLESLNVNLLAERQLATGTPGLFQLPRPSATHESLSSLPVTPATPVSAVTLPIPGPAQTQPSAPRQSSVMQWLLAVALLGVLGAVAVHFVLNREASDNDAAAQVASSGEPEDVAGFSKAAEVTSESEMISNSQNESEGEGEGEDKDTDSDTDESQAIEDADKSARSNERRRDRRRANEGQARRKSSTPERRDLVAKPVEAAPVSPKPKEANSKPAPTLSKFPEPSVAPIAPVKKIPKPSVVTPKISKPPALMPFRVSISTSVRGPLAKGEVSRKVKGRRNALSSCYAAARKKVGTDRFGTVTAKFRIGSARRAEGVSVGRSSLPGLSSCVASQLRSIKTVNASDTGATRVTVRVSFSQK